MTWKLRLINYYNFTAITIEVEAATRAEARAIYEADWSRFNYLDKIQLAMTKPQIIEAILTDMEAKQGPHEDKRARYGGYLRTLNKAKLEGILEARLGLDH